MSETLEEEVQQPELSPSEALLQTWQYLSGEERASRFRALSQDQAEELIFALKAREQADLLTELTRAERRLWIRFLPPDDAADLIQEADESVKREFLDLLDPSSRVEVTGLLSYREDEAGGLMNPRFARVRPDMLVAEAIRYVRKQALSAVNPVNYVYVLDSQQKLLGVMSLRQLFLAPAESKISEVMETDLVKVPDEMDQEAVSQIFSQHRYNALPVVDSEDRMQGIVTLDDILDVSREEATEDIQKLGGTEALDAPYPSVPLTQMIRKRASWLMILFVGEMFTASAMAHFQDEVSKAVVLALFIPLIISSGGNSGSQATTLIIRALALEELRLQDWWRVLMREILSGLSLGVILAAIGFTRIALWPNIWPAYREIYTEHYLILGAAVSVSLIGVVLFGSVVGAMLPFLLRRLKLDPASASAPLVATLVDVTGLVIYFQTCFFILKGRLL